MEERNNDELYEILDELNGQIEDIIERYDNPEAVEMVISMLQQKSQEFVYELEHEIEKLEIIEMVA